jgi:hypothetical protein
LVAINRRATRFPVQPLPDDLPTVIMQLADPLVQPGILSIPMLMQELARSLI